MPTLGDVVDLRPRVVPTRDRRGLGRRRAGRRRPGGRRTPDPARRSTRRSRSPARRPTWDADLLLTHHPLFLRGVHGVAETTPKGRTLATLTRAGCALLTAHTNADQARPGCPTRWPGALGLRDVRPVRPVGPPAGQARRVRPGRRRRAPSGRRWPPRARARSATTTPVSTRRRRGPVPAARGAPTRPSARWASSRSPTSYGSRRCCRGAAAYRVVRAVLAAHSVRGGRLRRDRAGRPGHGGDGRRPRRRRRRDDARRVRRQVARACPPTARGVLVGGDPERVVRRVALMGGAGDELLPEVARQRRRRLCHQRPAAPPGHRVPGEGRPLAASTSATGPPSGPGCPSWPRGCASDLGDTVEIRVSTICTDVWQARR